MQCGQVCAGRARHQIGACLGAVVSIGVITGPVVVGICPFRQIQWESIISVGNAVIIIICVAKVARAIAVCVDLVGIGNVRAVVCAIRVSVLIGIRLAETIVLKRTFVDQDQQELYLSRV